MLGSVSEWMNEQAPEVSGAAGGKEETGGAGAK